MARSYLLIPMASILLVQLFLVGSVQASEAKLKAVVNGFARKGIKIGVAVHEADTKKKIFSHNSTSTFNPASTMKVLTSVTALKTLMGTYQYKTTLSTDSLSRGTAKNLYVKGSGDPSLVEERLWRIAKDLKVRGVERIEGNIVIDNSFFDGFGFSGKEDASSRAYNASLSAVAVNFNSFAVVAKNYGASGLEVHIDPPTEYFELKSKIGGSGRSIAIDRKYKDGKEYVVATGGVSREKVKYANVVNPVQYAGTTLAWVLKQNGIEFEGKVKAGTASGGKKLFSDKSKPLSLIVRDLNKFSNNFTAEMIVKTLGAIKQGGAGSTEKGVKVLKAFASELGVDGGEYQVFNGSGLSRNNRVSPNFLNNVLIYAYGNNKIRSDFMASLAIGGMDGTLRSRMKSSALLGNVKAKTGTLHDVAALSGYLQTKSKKMMAYTILVNGTGAGSGGFYALQERLLATLYANY